MAGGRRALPTSRRHRRRGPGCRQLPRAHFAGSWRRSRNDSRPPSSRTAAHERSTEQKSYTPNASLCQLQRLVLLHDTITRENGPRSSSVHIFLVALLPEQCEGDCAPEAGRAGAGHTIAPRDGTCNCQGPSSCPTVFRELVTAHRTRLSTDAPAFFIVCLYTPPTAGF